MSGDQPAWESAPARVLQLARAFPDRLALDDGRERLSHGALAERALRAHLFGESHPLGRVPLGDEPSLRRLFPVAYHQDPKLDAEFQRLRGIKQLGSASLVYPGAVHTRFEHSIGTLHLCDQLLSACTKNAARSARATCCSRKTWLVAVSLRSSIL